MTHYTFDRRKAEEDALRQMGGFEAVRGGRWQWIPEPPTDPPAEAPVKTDWVTQASVTEDELAKLRTRITELEREAEKQRHPASQPTSDAERRMTAQIRGLVELRDQLVDKLKAVRRERDIARAVYEDVMGDTDWAAEEAAWEDDAAVGG